MPRPPDCDSPAVRAGQFLIDYMIRDKLLWSKNAVNKAVRHAVSAACCSSQLYILSGAGNLYIPIEAAFWQADSNFCVTKMTSELSAYLTFY
ncbi:hypothetical protein L585_08360 [Pantoea ananatis BRT175]|nr:hypothetical protein L585_08360 [Pantoea ananatis BRT175]